MKNLDKHIQVFVFALLMLTHSAWGQTLDALLKAVEDGDSQGAAFYLDRGMDPNTTNKEGHSILMLAARHGHASLVSMLIARKANLGRRSPAGDTALMMASLEGHAEVVRLLLAAGASTEGSGWGALHYGAFGGSVPVIRLLLGKGADKNATAPNGYTPLMLAVRNGHEDAARALLQADPDLRRKGNAGETALSIATQKGDTKLVELLKRAGASE